MDEKSPVGFVGFMAFTRPQALQILDLIKDEPILENFQYDNAAQAITWMIFKEGTEEGDKILAKIKELKLLPPEDRIWVPGEGGPTDEELKKWATWIPGKGYAGEVG
jgi:hypothetical protein